jgi:hypothetical protein
MPDGPPAPAFVSQARTMAVGARYRPGMPGRYRNRAASSFYRGNLVLGQTQDDLGIGQNQISQDCFTNLGLGSAPGIDQEPNFNTLKTLDCKEAARVKPFVFRSESGLGAWNITTLCPSS